MSKLHDLLNTIIGKVNASVKTEAQTLTDEQKAQARTNIGAAATGEGGGSSVQSDWSQTDEAATDFIKNKPDIPAVDTTLDVSGAAADAATVGDRLSEANLDIVDAKVGVFNAYPGSLKWDGAIGDREYVILEADEGSMLALVHVSDEVPTPLDGVYSCILTTKISDAFFTISTFISGAAAEDGAFLGEYMAIIPTDNYAYGEYIFPKKGVYFMALSLLPVGLDYCYYHICALTITGYVFQESSGVTSWEELEDKPFGEVSSGYSNTLTWDGNTEGLESVTDGVFPYYRVTPDTPARFSESVNGTVYTTTPDGVESVSIEAAPINEQRTVWNIFFGVLVYAPFTDDEGVTLEPGVWLIKVDGKYLSQITFDEAIFPAKETKTLDEKYLPMAKEEWTFTLEDGSTVTKAVYVG